MTHYQAPKGVFDILPSYCFDQPDLSIASFWQHLEANCRQIADLYAFEEIRTPIFEHTEVFTRSSGEASDIVSKEMYTFQDKGMRLVSLRPEGTAGVARAVNEHHLLRKQGSPKLFYIGPFFRYDRPQAGRYRQFHQFGAEWIGTKDPLADVQMITMLLHLYKNLGLKNLNLMINSVGDLPSRERYKKALIEFLIPFKTALSEESQARLDKNPLRILDSKDPKDQKIVASAPALTSFLSSEAADHFHQVCEGLKTLHIPFTISDRLVRGLDYYTHTVFEITIQDNLQAQNAIGAGGRYDHLLKDLGGVETPAFGFATGMERILLAMIAQQQLPLEKKGPKFFFIPLDASSQLTSLALSDQLRKTGFSAELYMKNFKIQKGLQQAYFSQAEYAVIIGESERNEQKVQIKNLLTKKECALSFETLIESAGDLTAHFA